RRRNARRRSREDVERLVLFRRQLTASRAWRGGASFSVGAHLLKLVQPGGGDRGNAYRLMGIRPPATRLGRQNGGNRFSGTRRVVRRGPERKVDDVRRNERTGIEQLSDWLDVDVAQFVVQRQRRVNDNSGDNPRPARPDHAGADGRGGASVRHAVCQQLERGNGNGDLD